MKHPLWAAPTLGLMLVLWTGCQKESGEPVKPVSSPEKSVTTAIHAAGFRVLESTCFSCHSPDATQENRVAPPMIAIKQHYLTGGTTKEDFTEALLAFMNHPTVEISKMPNAVHRFGLMPKMSLPEADIRSIAAYLYDTPIEAPGWFAAHFEQERKKYQNDPAHQSPIVQGQQLAMAAKAELGKNLLQAIKTKGAEGAVAFCNTRAIPLTDSMAQALNVHLRRVSDAPRNPKNQANTSELAYIQAVKTALAKGEQPAPRRVAPRRSRASSASSARRTVTVTSPPCASTSSIMPSAVMVSFVSGCFTPDRAFITSSRSVIGPRSNTPPARVTRPG